MSDTNGISLREMGRRMGVSGVAVRKAMDTGRIPADCVGTNPKNGRPTIIDPERAEKSWRDNTLQGRNHAAGQRRADKIGTKPSPGAVSNSPASTAEAAGQEAHDPGRSTGGGAYQKARTARETYQAKLAQLEFEERAGQLVKRDDLKVELFGAGRNLRDRLLQMPDRLSGELAGMTDQHDIALTLQREITAAMEELAHAFERIGDGR